MRAAGLAALALALTPAIAFAQMPPMGGPPPEIQQKIGELQSIKQQLDGIHEKAVAEPKLKKKIDSFKSEIESAMIKEDPSLKKSISRFDELNEKFEKAMAAGDQETAKKLAPELEQLATKLSTAQGEALKKDGMSKKAEAIQKEVVAAMKKVDPKTESLMNRADTLRDELRAAMQQQQMQGGGAHP